MFMEGGKGTMPLKPTEAKGSFTGKDVMAVTGTVPVVHHISPLQVQPRNGQNTASHYEELIGLM